MPKKVTKVAVPPPPPEITPEDGEKADNISIEVEIKEPIGRHSKKFKTLLRPVIAIEYFCDGMLSPQFKELGYPPEWNKGEVRLIPYWLYERCVQSGGEFEFVDE